jgi:hypothetical protein
MFDRARLLAGSNPQLLQHIEQQHTAHLVENNDAEELAARGNAAAAVEMYAAQGNWKRAHELVRGGIMLFYLARAALYAGLPILPCTCTSPALGARLL